MGKQEIEQLEIGARNMHRRAFEAEHRLVDLGAEIRMGLQQLLHAIDVARFDCRLEQLGWRFGQCLDFSLHLRPAIEAVSPRNHELSVAQDKVFRGRRFRVQRADALYRFRFAAPIGAREGLGELSLFVQVRVGGKRANERLGPRSDGSRDMMHLFLKARRPRYGRKEGRHSTSGFWSGGRFPFRGRGAP